MGKAESDSDLEYQDSREDAPGSLAASIAVRRSAPTTKPTSLPDLSLHANQDPESVPPVAHQQQDIEDSGELGDIHMGDLLEDAKFYQDASFEYQSAYEALHLQQEELQSRHTQQAHLIQEASGALKSCRDQVIPEVSGDCKPTKEVGC